MAAAPNINLPDGVKIHSSQKLVTWHPRGVLDAALVRTILAFIEVQEVTAAESFHRFTDLSALEAIHLSFGDVEDLAQRRVESYEGPPVKSAILALNPLAFGIARMYEQLMRRSPIEIGVFCGLTSAANWLNVPIELLATDG